MSISLSGTRNSSHVVEQRAATLRLLHRHQERRRQGVPTLTVIAGPLDARIEMVRCLAAAERYLFERLQSHPQTAGLFELNGLLTSAPSERPLEIDLLARGPKVAIEIDGYYHFTEPEAYRRDRRKDVLLQHAGYLVVRCLADDVASRLEEILETIVTAVRRRPTGQGRAGDRPFRSS